jgi:hypothetical protein
LNIEELMQRIFAQPKREHVKRETVNFEEDGNYYPMMNRLRVAISFGDFSAYEAKVLDYLVIRRFGTKYVVPTVTIPEMTYALQTDRNNLRKIVKGLCASGVIEVCGNLKNMPTYRICLDVRKWKMRCGDTSKGKELVNPAFTGGVRSLDTSIEAKNEVSGHPSMRYVDTSIDIEKDFKKENKKENIVGTEKDGSDESLSSGSLEEDQNQNKGGDPMAYKEESIRESWPLFLQKQTEERVGRRHKLSGLKKTRREGLTDEQILNAFNGKVSPEDYRELVEGKTHDEILKIQRSLITN